MAKYDTHYKDIFKFDTFHFHRPRALQKPKINSEILIKGQYFDNCHYFNERFHFD